MAIHFEFNNVGRYKAFLSKRGVTLERLLDNIENAFKDFIDENWFVSINFVSPELIKKINGEYRKIKSITDVLSFDFSEKKVNKRLGEVYVCLTGVEQNDEQFKVEIYRVIIHGVLHILGYDHDSNFGDSGKAMGEEKMYNIQESLLSKVTK